MHTVIVPAKNEQDSIGAVLADFREAFDSLEIEAEFVVVNDNSTDNTAKIALGLGARVVVPKDSSGLADVFRAGVSDFLATGGDVAVHVDADGQYMAADLATMLDAFKNQFADLVIGDRLWRQPEGMSDIRYFWNQSLADLVSTLAGTIVPDAQSGFRIFSRELAEHVKTTGRYTYTQEQVIRASRAGYKISSCPINFVRRASGKSRLVKTPYSYIARVMSDLEDVAMELGLDLEAQKFLRRGQE